MDLSKLINKIAEVENKYKQSKSKKESKITSDFYREHFYKVYRNTYGVGYVPKVIVERAIFIKLMKAFDHSTLLKVIDKFVTEYATIKGINVRSFPRPTITALPSFANNIVAELGDTEEVINGYQETDGLSF